MAVTSQWQSASDEDWALALAREAVIRPLTNQPELTERLVATASAELGISRSLVFRLVAKFRKRPQVSSLLPGKRGRKAAARALSGATEAVVREAIASIGAPKKHVVASLDQSLRRLGVDYVDIFYAHRPWPEVPMEETMSALAQLVKQAKTLHVGISSYSPERTRRAYELLKSEGVHMLIHQPSYSMLNRHIENGLLDVLGDLGVGCIGFSALAQGLLTNKYISGSASAGRALEGESFRKDFLSEENLKNVRGLAAIAKNRGQTLAQMAIAWVLRDDRVTSALIGARNVDQLDDSLDALKKQEFSAEELGEIDQFAKEGGIDLWRETSEL